MITLSKRLVRKTSSDKEIDRVNNIMNALEETNKQTERINESLVVCGNNVIDTKTFSIMSLPSTKQLLRNI